MNKLTAAFLILISAAPGVWAQDAKQIPPPPRGEQPVFKPGTVYQFQNEISYPGPKGWLGAIQENDPKTGAPRYASIPPENRAVYIRFNPVKMPEGVKYNPPVEVQVYGLDSKFTAHEMLSRRLNQVRKEDFLQVPANVNINGQTWAVAEFRVQAALQEAPGKQQPIVIHRKMYITLYKNWAFALNLTDVDGPSTAETIRAFDESVFQVRWTGQAPAKAA